MMSTHTGELPIDSLPLKARTAHIFPALGDTSLMSIGQLCDHKCEAHFNKFECVITHGNRIILVGKRNKNTHGLWIMELPRKEVALAAINHSAKPADLVAFAPAALFSPAISTLKQALLKGFLPDFPGLSTET